MGEVEIIEVNYLANPDFCAALYKAHQEASVATPTHKAVAGSIDLGPPDDPNGNSSVRRLVWQPFMQELCQRVLRPMIKDKVIKAQEKKESRTGAFDHVRIHPDSDGISVFNKATDRTAGAATAIEDGSNLANLTNLFTMISTLTQGSVLPTMHFDEGGEEKLWRCELENSEMADRVSELLECLESNLIRPILALGPNLPPLQSFHRGRKAFKRPATDGHGRSQHERVTGPQTVTATDGLVTFRTEKRLIQTGEDVLQQTARRLIGELQPDPPVASGASATVGQTRRDLFDSEHPWRPHETIKNQGEDLADLIASVEADPYLFLEIRDILEASSVQLTKSKTFGRAFGGHEGLDALFVCRDLLELMRDETLLSDEELQELWELAVNSIALAALSPRPSIFSALIAAAVHGLSLEMDDPVAASRLELLLSHFQQQYMSSLMGIVLYTDRDRFWAEDPVEQQNTTRVAVLCDLLCHHGRCLSCAKATFAAPEYFPRRDVLKDGDPRILSWTTMGLSSAVPETIYSVEEVQFGLYGGQAPGRNMIGCFASYEWHNISLAARCADKASTALTHKKCKWTRGRRTAMPFLMSEALKRAGEGR